MYHTAKTARGVSTTFYSSVSLDRCPTGKNAVSGEYLTDPRRPQHTKTPKRGSSYRQLPCLLLSLGYMIADVVGYTAVYCRNTLTAVVQWCESTVKMMFSTTPLVCYCFVLSSRTPSKPLSVCEGLQKRMRSPWVLPRR